MLGSGLGRLRAVLFAGPEAEATSLAEMTASLSDQCGCVSVEIGPDLMVATPATQVAETIRQLLANATERAPSRPVRVRARRLGERVELWVDDLGPRLSVSSRRAVGQPDGKAWRSGPVGAIHIGTRLAQGQGATLRVEARPGGGESFRVSWPAYLGPDLGVR